MSEEELRTMCHQYFLAQQGLQHAEEESNSLDAAIHNLESQLGQKNREFEQAKFLQEDVQKELDNMRHLPQGVSPHTAKAYVEQEKKLHTTIALADGAIHDTAAETEKIIREIESEARSVEILEESVAAQVRFNHLLIQNYKQANERIKREVERISTLTARKEFIEEECRKHKKKEKQLANSVNCRSLMKGRAQDEIGDRDFEALRLRRDATFSKRMYLTELEHSRSQEVFLQQLMMENRRLKSVLLASRKGLPDLGKLKQEDDDNVDEEKGGEKKKEPSGMAVEYTPHGSTKHVDVVEIPSTFGDHEDDHKKKSSSQKKVFPSREAKILEEMRSENLKLLQQMVGSMHLLQQEFVVKKGTAPVS